jgi:glyoxylase-like metal-dependent hydrolase (beta-lactamase superfamily II)
LAASLRRSVERLRFEWVLPGHGDRKHLTVEEMTDRLRSLTVRVQALRPQPPDFTLTNW